MKKIFILILIFSTSVFASQTGDRLISTGRHSGKKLIDVVSAYRVPGSGNRIPSQAVENAFEFFDRYYGTQRRFQQLLQMPLPENPSIVSFFQRRIDMMGPTLWNPYYITIFDMNLHSSKRRVHIISLRTGEITSIEGSHGLETDCGGSRYGYACRFISDRESKASPLGFFATGPVYNSSKGPAIPLNGLQTTNDFPSTIVIHPARYVGPGHAGRSWGCVAVSNSNMTEIQDEIKDGTLFYFYHDSLNSERTEPVVSGLMQTADSAASQDDEE